MNGAIRYATIIVNFSTEKELEKIDDVLGGFIREQLLVVMIIGVLSSMALLLLGDEYWIILGLLAGLDDTST